MAETKQELTIPNNKDDVREKGSLTDAIASYYLQNGNIDSGKALAIAKSVVATIKSNDYLKTIAMGNIDSLIDCINQAISIGLTIDANQYCWLVPYNCKVGNQWIKKIQLQIGYKGYIYKINKAFPSSKVQAVMVYKGDEVDIKKIDNNDVVNHTYNNPFDKDKDVEGAYCIIRFADGSSFVETIGKDELDLIKSKSKTKEKDGYKTVWQEWYSEMCKKSVIRRACKSLFPSELAELNEIDNEQYDLKQPKTEGLEKLNNESTMEIK